MFSELELVQEEEEKAGAACRQIQFETRKTKNDIYEEEDEIDRLGRVLKKAEISDSVQNAEMAEMRVDVENLQARAKEIKVWV